MADADPYVYPGTDVLRNKFNIRDADRLRVAEANVTGPKIAELGSRRLAGTYDLAHLQRFHREIFSGVYPWAGEIRSVYIAKSQLFAAPQNIGPYLRDQLDRLGAKIISGGSTSHSSWSGPPTTWLKSMQCIRSERATAARSGPFSASSPVTPVTPSPGLDSILIATSKHPRPVSTATTPSSRS